MEIAFLVIAVIGLLALSGSSGGTVSGGGRLSYAPNPNGPPGPWTPTPAYGVAPPYSPMQSSVVNGEVTSANSEVMGKAVTGGAAVGASAAGIAASTAGFTAAATTGLITAGVGVVVAIGIALEMAHLQRVKQAKDENSAMNLGVVGWDADVHRINAAYNGRQIDPQSAMRLIQTATANYWRLVTPHIQPGRNGCSSGANCQEPTPCSGSIGAACCVGCNDLVNSSKEALRVIQQGGGQSLVYKVFGSKYGGLQRDQYILTWKR